MLAPLDTVYDADREVELKVSAASDSDPEDTRVATEAELATPLPVTPLRVVVTPVEIAAAAIDARRAAATVSLAPGELDDEWFGSFDETKPFDGGELDDQKTTTWRRISDWLLRRAA